MRLFVVAVLGGLSPLEPDAPVATPDSARYPCASWWYGDSERRWAPHRVRYDLVKYFGEWARLSS